MVQMNKINRDEAEKILASNNKLLIEDGIPDEIALIEEEINAVSENLDRIENQSDTEENLNPVVKVSTQQIDNYWSVSNANPVFAAALEEMELYIESDGIYSYHQEMKHRRSNFSTVSFEYTVPENDTRLRVYKFDDITIELLPQDLTSKANFNRRLLEQSNLHLELSNVEFVRFKTLLIEMDNGKIVQNNSGFGRVANGLFNLGNKVVIDDQLQDHRSLIWKGDAGYSIEQTDQIKISENPLALSEIAHHLFNLYESKAILIFGFAIATLFFQQYMKRKKHFPILYLRGASGRGKSCMAELICKLSGMDESLYVINCAGNSTKIGAETKSVLLNNLPIVFNELAEEQFNYIKSRSDGHGSVKFSERSKNSLVERTVSGSSIVTTVVEPHDKQIISRSVYINLDDIDMKKTVFDQVRAASPDFSNFIVKVIQSLSFEQLMDHVDRFLQKIGKTDIPRILENYALIGGSFMAFKSICKDASNLPSDEEVVQFIRKQTSKTESLLNPISFFIYELERLHECGKAKTFITQDEKFVYFNFEGVWSEISDAYKHKYFPYMNKRNLQELLKESEFIARAGIDLPIGSMHEAREPVTQFPKKINSNTRRCFVLRKDKLPGYFR